MLKQNAIKVYTLFIEVNWCKIHQYISWCEPIRLPSFSKQRFYYESERLPETVTISNSTGLKPTLPVGSASHTYLSIKISLNKLTSLMLTPTGTVIHKAIAARFVWNRLYDVLISAIFTLPYITQAGNLKTSFLLDLPLTDEEERVRKLKSN